VSKRLKKGERGKVEWVKCGDWDKEMKKRRQKENKRWEKAKIKK
jgi:hypothetical protein